MSNQLAVQQLTKDLSTQMKPISSALPPGMDPKRFMRTAVNAISTHAQSDRLLAADRQSLFMACQKAASDGLVIDGKEATLVTFKDQVQYMPMVQGLVKLARNSGEISSIVAEVVFSEDDFTYRPGLDEQPVHDPDWFEERGAPKGAYAVITTKDGQKIVTVMNQKRIMAIANGGRNAHQYTPGKGPHYQEWWKKTVIKNALKYAPKSTYLESAMDHDNEGYDPDAVPADTEVRDPIKDINADLGINEADEPRVVEGEVVDTEVDVI